jgi:hypothetical protein
MTLLAGTSYSTQEEAFQNIRLFENKLNDKKLQAEDIEKYLLMVRCYLLDRGGEQGTGEGPALRATASVSC